MLQLIRDLEQLFRETGDSNFNLIIIDYSSTDVDVRKALEKSSLPKSVLSLHQLSLKPVFEHLRWYHTCVIQQVPVCKAEWEFRALCWSAGWHWCDRCELCNITSKFIVLLLFYCLLRSATGWPQHCVPLWSPHSLPSFNHWHSQEALCGGIHGVCSYSPQTGLRQYAVRGQRWAQIPFTHFFFESLKKFELINDFRMKPK